MQPERASTSKPLSTDPNDHIKTSLLNFTVALVLGVVGIFLIKHGLEPSMSLSKELWKEIGSAFLVAALIDLSLLSGLELLKKKIAAPYVKLAIQQQEYLQRCDDFLKQTITLANKITDELFQKTVTTDLELLLIKTEEIHYAVDENHRTIVNAARTPKQEQSR